MNTPSFSFQPVHFFATTDIVVVGCNPESADVVNPRGEYFGYAGYVVAEDADGRRVRWHVGTQMIERQILPQCDALAAALIKRLANGKLPVAFEQWGETFPAYGSQAYSAEDAIAWERSLET